MKPFERISFWIELNVSLPFGISDRTTRLPVLINFSIIVLINEDNNVLLVRISKPDELGIFRIKLSIDLSGMLGSNFTEFPQKTDAATLHFSAESYALSFSNKQIH